jgi:hypothetical protein
LLKQIGEEVKNGRKFAFRQKIKNRKERKRKQYEKFTGSLNFFHRKIGFYESKTNAKDKK